MSFGEMLSKTSKKALEGVEFTLEEFSNHIYSAQHPAKSNGKLFNLIKRNLLEAANKGITQLEMAIEFDSSNKFRPSSKIVFLGISKKGNTYRGEIPAATINKFFMVKKSLFKKEHEYILNNSFYKEVISWNDLLALFISISLFSDIEFTLHNNLDSSDKIVFNKEFTDGKAKIEKLIEKYYSKERKNVDLAPAKLTLHW